MIKVKRKSLRIPFNFNGNWYEVFNGEYRQVFYYKYDIVRIVINPDEELIKYVKTLEN